MGLTVVQLTPKEAEAFVSFRKHQELLGAILASDIPNLRNGQAVLHFGPNGLMRIEVNRLTYLRGKS